jgi:hypothetical protein
MKINNFLLFFLFLLFLPSVNSVSISPPMAEVEYIPGASYEYNIQIGSDKEEVFQITPYYDDLSEEARTQLEGSLSFDKTEITFSGFGSETQEVVVYFDAPMSLPQGIHFLFIKISPLSDSISGSSSGASVGATMTYLAQFKVDNSQNLGEEQEEEQEEGQEEEEEEEEEEEQEQEEEPGEFHEETPLISGLTAVIILLGMVIVLLFLVIIYVIVRKRD